MSFALIVDMLIGVWGYVTSTVQCTHTTVLHGYVTIFLAMHSPDQRTSSSLWLGYCI